MVVCEFYCFTYFNIANALGNGGEFVESLAFGDEGMGNWKKAGFWSGIWGLQLEFNQIERGTNLSK